MTQSLSSAHSLCKSRRELPFLLPLERVGEETGGPERAFQFSSAQEATRFLSNTPFQPFRFSLRRITPAIPNRIVTRAPTRIQKFGSPGLTYQGATVTVAVEVVTSVAPPIVVVRVVVVGAAVTVVVAVVVVVVEV